MQEILNKFSLRELRLLLIGLGAAITVAMLAGFVFPNIKALRSASNMVSVFKEASLDGGELDGLLREQQSRNAELRYRLHGDMANLPAQQVESFIIGQLQMLSWNNNVELVSVRPSFGDEIQVFQEMLFEVELAGRYRDLYGWLWEARRELGFVVIKELSLRRSDNDDNEPLLLANLNLASYRSTE